MNGITGSDITIGISSSSCPYCGTDFSVVYHFGGMCPKVKAIEYFSNGAVKRVELWNERDEQEDSRATIREG